MPTTMSPLRYPGGKTTLYAKVVDILRRNGLEGITYVEPFAGGAGLAIKLLLNNNVSNIIINDVDPSIHAFWHSVLHEHDELCSRIRECEISTEEREKQIQVLKDLKNQSMLDIGFATLFLNRTNVSGILSAGPIGGKEQSGKNKIDARFNKAVLISKIITIAKCRHQISLNRLDVINFIDAILPTFEPGRLFLNFDPPYVKKGQELYLNHFTMQDHKRLRDKVVQSHHYWIVTYDYNNNILDLYSSFFYERIQLNHSAGNMKKGEEIVIYSDNLIAQSMSAATSATLFNH